MTVVSNASPLINLARIGNLDLLRHLYSELVIPEAVWHQVVIEGAGQPGAAQVKASDRIKVQVAGDKRLVRVLRQELDAGEAEAIVLALEREADLLLMDERSGRETARHLGLRYAGLIGVLLEAKRRRLIPAIKPQLDILRDIAGFRIGAALYLRVLRDQGEM